MNKLYEVLGLLKDALPRDIKAAYRSLAQKHHPDKGGDTVRFQEVQEAYDVLSDPQRRADYDATGSTRSNGPPIRDQAMAEFGAMLNALMCNPNFDIDHTNMVDQMALLIGSKLNDIAGQRNAVEGKVKRSENARNRMMAKQGDNAMVMILDHIIREDNALLLKIKSAEAVFREMTTILEQYEYKVDTTTVYTAHPWTTMFASPTSI
jgi:curved DNA-binding protein CbpA